MYSKIEKAVGCGILYPMDALFFSSKITRYNNAQIRQVHSRIVPRMKSFVDFKLYNECFSSMCGELSKHKRDLEVERWSGRIMTRRVQGNNLVIHWFPCKSMAYSMEMKRKPAFIKDFSQNNFYTYLLIDDQRYTRIHKEESKLFN